MGAIIGISVMTGALWHALEALEGSRREALRANDTIRALGKEGWTSPPKPRLRAKNGRFLSKDDANRAIGIPADFAREMARMEEARRGIRSGIAVSVGRIPSLQDEASERIGGAIENHFADRPFYDPERDA